MTIELTLGRAVKWQVADAWHTGRVLDEDDFCAFWGTKEVVLVKDTCTSRVFAVPRDQLTDNTCREDERKAEATQ